MKYNEVDPLLYKRDSGAGGVGALFTGNVGSGKTNALASIALHDMALGNMVLWRGKNTCMWSIFLNRPKVRLIFWMEQGMTYELYDRKKDKDVSFSDYGEVREWKEPENLIRSLEKGVVNVVYTVPHTPRDKELHQAFINTWAAIMDAMIMRRSSGEISFFFDEFEDLCPMDKFYKMGAFIGDLQKEMRKNRINSFYATQRYSDVFWKTASKVPWRVWMRGSRVCKDSAIKSKTLPLRLRPGHAVIEGRFFEKMRFKFLGYEKELRAFIKPTDEYLKKIGYTVLKPEPNRKCTKCGYEWNYKGALPNPTCPNCFKKTKPNQ